MSPRVASRVRAGLFPEHGGVALPVHESLRLTVPAREAIARAGNRIARREGRYWPLYTVTLAWPPAGLVLCLIGTDPPRHPGIGAQHHGLRMEDEPRFPGEWGAGAVGAYERADWLPCPACGASLVWYEAGYVPGYRVCSAPPHHHVQLAPDGREARPVYRR